MVELTVVASNQKSNAMVLGKKMFNIEPNIIEKLAKDVSQALTERGFIVHITKSHSTNSVYLKIDYGACGTVRISDHHGKRHLHFRYNLISKISSSYNVYNIFPGGRIQKRIFYAFRDSNRLVEDIKTCKREKILKFGEDTYRSFMLDKMYDMEGQKAIWQLLQKLKTA